MFQSACIHNACYHSPCLHHLVSVIQPLSSQYVCHQVRHAYKHLIHVKKVRYAYFDEPVGKERKKLILATLQPPVIVAYCTLTCH